MDDPGGSPTGTGTRGDVVVVAADEQTDVDVDADRWCRLAAQVLEAEGEHGELTLTFVDADAIAELNAEHLDHEGPTDVLSFPLDAGQPATDGQPRLLGDIVICPAVAVANAPRHAGTPDDEIALLVVHGALHILGHDHAEAEDTAVMRARELDHLMTYHWDGPAPARFRHEPDTTLETETS